ncbi:MAG: hypothetical protein WD042_08480 [Phycisphaeraceae bacterium]
MAYLTSRTARERIKEAVFEKIAPGQPIQMAGRETYRILGCKVHARYCAQSAGNYKFNLNPNSLRADYELWICGTDDLWYLIPISVIRQMYGHSDAYPDRHHSGIHVVSVDSRTHLAGYARPSVSLDLTPYCKGVLR